jgi:hypothetical protein
MKPSATGSDRLFQYSSLEIKRCVGGQCFGELAELRRLVWVRETGLLTEEELFGDDDQQGIHLLICDVDHGDRVVASTCAVEAERSFFAHHTGFAEHVLRDAVVSTRSTVHPDYRNKGLFSLLLYLGTREGRKAGRRWVAAFLEPGAVPGRVISGARDLKQVPPYYVRGGVSTYEVVATAVDVNYVMSNCFRRIPADLLPYLREHFFVDEIVDEVMRGARRFHEGPWFRAVEKSQLTRWQYYRTLAEMHLYVRWTTRLLGATVGITADPELRRHYLQHLGGEIDHELMLENDIAQLGFDVDYVKHYLTPSEDIRTFMSLQESLCCGPRRDPSLFLAVPFAIEALTAFLTGEFLEQLAANIASWGVAEPARAMTFITAHLRSDGGTDGHWDAARQILHRHLAGEKELQEFLSIVRLVQSSLHRAFTAWVTAPDIFVAPSRSTSAT